MRMFYNLLLLLYGCGIRIAAPFHGKARDWVDGRKDWRGRLKATLQGKPGGRLWMHCASLGEFEQGRPVLEAWRSRFPDQTIVLTFFSPSGYKHHRATGLVDAVFYLPLDGPSSSRDFIDLVDPSCVLFVKYEFWYHYSKALAERRVPLFCISAIFRPGQVFFRSYGGFFLGILKRFSVLFVQDERSLRLLQTHGIRNVSVTGDTRFDRVIQNASREFSHPVVDAFASDRLVLVAGSTWPDDEEVLLMLKQKIPNLHLIIAPHEIGEERVVKLCSRFGPHAVRLSRCVITDTMMHDSKVLVIDSIGMLSSLYRFGKYTYVGGGFGKGIHNTLEAAVYGKPVFFGPNHMRFREAVAMIQAGCAFSFDSADGLFSAIDLLEKDAEAYASVSSKAAHFVEGHAGATVRILDRIFAELERK